MPLLQALLVFGGGTVGVITLITLLVLAPSVARGPGHRHTADRWSEPLWFGGPTGALDSGESSERKQLETSGSRCMQTEPVGGGGAGARW